MPFHLETPRLLIRPWEPADRPVFAGFVRNVEMMRYISFGKAWDDDRIEAFFQRQGKYLADHGCCVGAVVLQESGRVIGIAGIQPLDKAKTFEFAWWIWKDYWGQGLATEAAEALKDYAFGVLGLPRVVAIADVPNRASSRVMQKIGMQYAGVRNAHDLAERHPEVEVVYYTLDNPATKT
jgi:ribosomal-protein-alanine N-acetyltransferase